LEVGTPEGEKGCEGRESQNPAGSWRVRIFELGMGTMKAVKNGPRPERARARVRAAPRKPPVFYAVVARC